MPEETQQFRTTLSDIMAEVSDRYPSVRAVAAAVGVTKTTLYDLVAGYTRPSQKTLKGFEKILSPEQAARLYRAAGEALPAHLADVVCPPYCETAKAIAEKLGVSKDEAIQRAVDNYAKELAVSQ